MNERIIVSLTTWSARVGNIPAVLDTILSQTIIPDKIVLNVAYELEIPINVQHYLNKHKVEIFRCPDTKVYKKLIPTLRRYPNDCVITIDDDWLYPDGMIADFMEIHKRYPEYPISGNRVVMFGMQCHCGCASLTKAEYFGKYLNFVDEKLIRSCPSDDFMYTFLANRNGHPYVRTQYEYSENMDSIYPYHPYSNSLDSQSITLEYDFLIAKFGITTSCFKQYVKDLYISSLLEDISRNEISYAENRIRNTTSYCLGRFLIAPLRKIKKVIANKKKAERN